VVFESRSSRQTVVVIRPSIVAYSSLGMPLGVRVSVRCSRHLLYSVLRTAGKSTVLSAQNLPPPFSLPAEHTVPGVEAGVIL
jgi:hypothetical protein